MLTASGPGLAYTLPAYRLKCVGLSHTYTSSTAWSGQQTHQFLGSRLDLKSGQDSKHTSSWGQDWTSRVWSGQQTHQFLGPRLDLKSLVRTANTPVPGAKTGPQESGQDSKHTSSWGQDWTSRAWSGQQTHQPNNQLKTANEHTRTPPPRPALITSDTPILGSKTQHRSQLTQHW